MKATTICVIDDNPDLLSNLREFLQLEGFIVASFSSGKEALAWFDRQIPDLIITDLWMPEMDGLELIEIMKNRKSDIPIIVFSAKPPVEYEEKARSLGATAFVNKPATLEEILSKIYSLIKINHE